MMIEKTYVFDGIEVRKTGRTASATSSSMTSREAKKRVLIEITPVTDFDWKKWVTQEQLYEVDT